ncbi:MAG TPA: hypothetical protein VH144_02100, partial [Candidatus Saccharimonadales bacterium]|nr:hypothetical protein [Candidatus Saccharimonadales bacterium]
MLPSVERFSHQETETIYPNEILAQYNAHPIALLQTYEYFTQPDGFGRSAKAEFLEAVSAGRTPDAPRFSYPKLDLSQLIEWRHDVAAMLEAISDQDLQDEKNRLIRESITTRLAEVGIMLLTKLQAETNPDDPEYVAISWQLKQNMREVYGAPEKEEFQGILGARLDSLKDVIQATDLPDEIAEAATYIRNELPEDLPIGRVYQPRPETLAWYGQRLQERCEPSIQLLHKAINDGEVILDEASKLDSDNIIKATNLILTAKNQTDWKALPTTNTNIDTSQADKAFYIPRSRKMTLQEFHQV